MTTNVTKAPELAALVKPVRALLTKKRKLNAIKLVCERIPYGLKEAEDFVDYVQARPHARAENLAELWMNLLRESVVEAVELDFEPVAMQEEEGVSPGEWYTRYMETHSYADWVQLIEDSIALRQAEDEPGLKLREANDNAHEL